MGLHQTFFWNTVYENDQQDATV